MIGFKLGKVVFGNTLPDAVKKSNKRFLMQAGGYVRTTIRRSMRFRKKASPAGTPPSAHRADAQHPHGPLLREFVRFAYDPLRESVVVGPEKLRGTQSTTPSKQEYGYTARIKTFPKKRGGRIATPAQREAFLRKVRQGEIVRRSAPVERTISVPARPSARPGLAVNLPKFPTLYARYFGPGVSGSVPANN